jgi:hypothetical protein
VAAVVTAPPVPACTLGLWAIRLTEMSDSRGAVRDEVDVAALKHAAALMTAAREIAAKREAAEREAEERANRSEDITQTMRVPEEGRR